MTTDLESVRQLYLEMYLHTPGRLRDLERAFRQEHGLSYRALHRWRQAAGLTAKMRNRSIHAQQYEQAKKLLEQGCSSKAAARKCGLSATSLREWLCEDGYRFALGQHGGLLELKREKQQAAIAALKKGVYYDDLAEKIGVPEHTLKAWHQRYLNGTLDLMFVAEQSTKVGRGRRINWEERAHISLLRKAGKSAAAIARELGRSQSTIHREIARNSDHDGSYDAIRAQQRATTNLRRPRPRKLDTNLALRRKVIAGLESRWSPQQIAGYLARCGKKSQDGYVSHETIYQALYIQGKGSLREELEVEKALRSGRKGRKPRSKLPPRSNRSWIGKDSHISKRPASAEDRAVPGHWEGDLVIGKGGTTALITCVERTTRYTMIRKLDTHDAASTTDRLIEMFTGLMRNVTKTLTWDQGAEMADAERFSLARAIPVYYCDPHSPWQRPTNENTNGLVRDFLPKGTDFSNLTDEEVQEIQDLLNGRPRRILKYYTPHEKMNELFI